MSELLPCPFCGEVCVEGPRQEYIERAAGYGHTVYNVGHAQLSSSRTKCIAWVTAESRSEAIERWNARAARAATAPTVAVDECPCCESKAVMLSHTCRDCGAEYATHGDVTANAASVAPAGVAIPDGEVI